MNKELIIVESPAKVRTIRKFLGSEYLVEASVGHIRDLPSKTLGVEEDDGFHPKYEVLPSKKKVVSKLKKAAAQAEQVYLAPDPDREGEAIAWHIAELLKGTNPRIKRIQFNEITKSAVRQALAAPRDLDERLFNSQQARRILDRLVGYRISPLLWQKVKRGISAGRVQSVALRLIVERERERQNFVPEEYWILKSQLQDPRGGSFEAELWKLDGKKAKVGSGDEAEAIDREMRQAAFSIADVQEKDRTRQPKPPFVTSTLQQEASNRLKFSAKKTMTLAQQLYEGLELGHEGTTALITYMRTDSVRISKEAQEQAKEWILSAYGKGYYPSRPRSFKGKKGAQDAHEAIRPVDVSITPEAAKPHLSRDLHRLYSLIWKRFVASQMAAATFKDTLVTVQAGRAIWRAKGERLTFAGFLELYTPDDISQENELPPLQAGEPLSLTGLKKEQKFTQPPARYSEASLVRKLEEQGIGRPSTYAQIISTLREREYVRMEKRQFVPTELGYTVNNLLVDHFHKLMDVGFTAQMEEQLDQVAEGEMDWQSLLKSFSSDFYPTLEKAEQEMAQVKTGLETGLNCQECGRPLVVKFGKNGEFLACSGYPECTRTTNFSRDEKGHIQIEEPQPQAQERVGSCPECGSDLVLKRSRTGSRFIACSGYPDCKYTEPYSTGVGCPVEGCRGDLVEKSSRRGKVFYACNRYPDCTYALWDYPVARPCPDCDHPVLVRKSTKSRGEHIACPQRSCRYWEKIEGEEG